MSKVNLDELLRNIFNFAAPTIVCEEDSFFASIVARGLMSGLVQLYLYGPDEKFRGIIDSHPEMKKLILANIYITAGDSEDFLRFYGGVHRIMVDKRIEIVDHENEAALRNFFNEEYYKDDETKIFNTFRLLAIGIATA